MFDAGNKGFITEDELADILGQAFGMDEVDIHELFERVDTDKDGKISYGKPCHLLGIISKLNDAKKDEIISSGGGGWH